MNAEISYAELGTKFIRSGGTIHFLSKTAWSGVVTVQGWKQIWNIGYAVIALIGIYWRKLTLWYCRGDFRKPESSRWINYRNYTCFAEIVCKTFTTTVLFAWSITNLKGNEEQNIYFSGRSFRRNVKGSLRTVADASCEMTVAKVVAVSVR